MLSPSPALIISIVILLILIRLKVNVGITIFIGALSLSLLSLPLNNTPALLADTLFNYDTIRLLIIIACALTLASLMERKGMLKRLAIAMESLNPKLALHLVPSIIGLVPMPAGALVSAAASKDLAERTGLNPEQKTFINYWFRHIWEFSMPIYPSIILLSAVLSVSVASIVSSLMPVTLIAASFGGFFSWLILRGKKITSVGSSDNIIFDILTAAWPIITLVVSVLFGLDPLIAFPSVTALLLITGKFKSSEISSSLKYGFNRKIMLLLFSVLFFQNVILECGAVDSIFVDMNSMGLPHVVILMVLPLLIASVTGISIAFTGITFPLLVPFIVTDGVLDPFALVLAYTSGIIGMLITPIHLCLIMSVEYFRAELSRIYRYIIPPSAALLAFATTAYLIFSK